MAKTNFNAPIQDAFVTSFAVTVTMTVVIGAMKKIVHQPRHQVVTLTSFG